jgi:hypothetical protein
MKYIYVIAINNGCEGHSPPMQAFSTYKEAKAAKALNYQIEIFKVSIWPEAFEGQWYNIHEYKE